MSHLATGAIADLYIARQKTAEGLEERLVVKALQARYAQDPRLARMFLDEARRAAELRHPSIVQVHDVGEATDTKFIAMEYIQGGTLSDIIRRGVAVGKFLPIEHALHIVSQVAAGLDHAHRHHDARGEALRVVHGKVSLSNIMVSDQGQAKLIAFGSSLIQAEIPRESQMRPAQARYLSPEQVAGEAIDHRSDIYSLGVALYETTAAQPLWRGPTEEILKCIRSEPIRPPTSVRPDYPAALAPIVMKALEKRPADRYQSADQLRQELEDFVGATGLRSGAPELAHYLRDLFAMATPFPDQGMAPVRRVHADRARSPVAAGDQASANAGARGATATGVRRLAWHRRGPAAVRWATMLAILPLAALAAYAFRGRSPARSDAPAAPPSDRAPQVRRPSAPGAQLEASLVSPSRPADPPTLAVIEAPPSAAPRRLTVSGGAARPPRQRQSQRAIPVAGPTPAAPHAEAPPAAVRVAPPAPRHPQMGLEEARVTQPASFVAPARRVVSLRSARSSDSTTVPASPAAPLAPVVDSGAVADVVRAHASEVQACFDRAVMEKPDLQGRLLVRAAIDGEGRVLEVARSGPAIAGGGRLQECVLAAFRRWTFRPAPGGGKASVTYSFKFE